MTTIPKMRGGRLAISSSLCLALVLVVASTRAAPFTPDGIVANWATQNGAAAISYDTSTDIFTAENTSSGVRPRTSFDNVIPDLQATFTLEATIDETGAFTGGSFAWVGSSAVLGIHEQETLLSGSLTGFNDIYIAIQFLGSVDFINPLLEGILGPVNTVLWAVAIGSPCFDDPVYACDYSFDQPVTPETANLWLSPIQSPRFTLTDLGTIDLGTESVANAINDEGEIVGQVRGPGGWQACAFESGVIYLLDGGLGTAAEDIANSQAIFGRGRSGSYGGAIWPDRNSAGQLFYPNPGDFEYVLGGNEAGVAVGYATDVVGGISYLRAAIGTQDQGWSYIGPLSSFAYAINDSGAIVGAYYDYPELRERAAIWNNNNVMPLEDNGDGTGISRGYDINNQGVTVGYSELTWSDPDQATVWDNAGQHIIGALPGDSRSTALSINESSEIVGWSRGGPIIRGFYWTEETGMIDVNSLIIDGPTEFVSVVEPRDINNRGQIVGVGKRNGIYERAVLLSPCGTDDVDGDGVQDQMDNCNINPNALQLDGDGDGYGNACDADLNNDQVVNSLDLGILRSLFFTTSPVADLNGDGAVNALDLGLVRRGFFGSPGPSCVPSQ